MWDGRGHSPLAVAARAVRPMGKGREMIPPAHSCRGRCKMIDMLKKMALGCVVALGVATPAAAEQVVVTADKMIDVLAGKTIEHPAIFITDGRITSVADARTVRWGAGVKHIDLSGKTILPGLIDMHVHLTGLAEVGGYQGLRYTDSFWTAIGVANAKTTLKLSLIHISEPTRH